VRTRSAESDRDRNDVRRGTLPDAHTVTLLEGRVTCAPLQHTAVESRVEALTPGQQLGITAMDNFWYKRWCKSKTSRPAAGYDRH